MIQALDNNPLKFAPTATDALKIMFGPRTSGYLDARRAFDGAFTDLKTHQIMTFAAMQQAVRMLVEDLDPKRSKPPPARTRASRLCSARTRRGCGISMSRAGRPRPCATKTGWSTPSCSISPNATIKAKRPNDGR